MDDLNLVLGSNGSKMFQKKVKTFSIIDVVQNKEINWLESPPRSQVHVPYNERKKGMRKRRREKKGGGGVCVCLEWEQ